MKKISVFILIVLCMLPACSDQEDCVITGEENTKEEISIMSFNIRYDNEADGINKWANRKTACVDMITQLKPALLGIQEGLHHQIVYLEEQLPDYDYIGVGRDDGDEAGEYCAIFYLKDRFDVVASNTFWLSETPDVPSVGWDAALERIVTWIQVKEKASQQAAFVFNTHFDHQGREARENSAVLLMDKIREIATEEAATFITGDFNAFLIQESIFGDILSEFEEAQTSAPITDSIRTFNSWGGPLNWTIDFIFYKNADITLYKTINDDFGVPYISDHYPIMARFN